MIENRGRRAAFAAVLLFMGADAGAAQQDTIPRDTARVRLEAVIVSSTRTGRRVEDEPLRIEVVGREEIEEKLLMTPGDISMLLNETGGVRVQATAPTLGGAAVRIQGLRGRYAQILSDGLPLYGEATGLGPLQIPPMDLAQVEVIKGPASALYGASALGGVINLLPRRPDGEREVLLNVTTERGGDGVLWLSSGEEARLGWTLVAGGHTQTLRDVSDDGWADIPSHRRATVRPRVFLGDERSSLMVTAGAMVEERTGGLTPTARALLLLTPFGQPDMGKTELTTRRLDAGAVAGTWLGERRLSIRLSAMQADLDRTWESRRDEERHWTNLAEAALSSAWRGQTWVLGAAVQNTGLRFGEQSPFNHELTTPGLFVQHEWSAGEWLAMSTSGRVDLAGDFGTLFSPRVSLLLRPGEWNVRASAGLGHHVPHVLIEDVEAIGVGALTRFVPLDVERARAVSLDVGREIGEVEVNVTGFGSIVDDALALRDDGGLVVVNVPGETRTWGGEVLVRGHVDPLHATLSYAYTRATEPSPAGGPRRQVEMTPRHTAGVVAMYEMEGRGRIGAEAYYTGVQALHENPYRARSRPYVVFGVLAEHAIGPARLFINFENIGDVRQSRYDPLLLPAPVQGRRTTEAWAPLDGRVINGGVRWSF